MRRLLTCTAVFLGILIFSLAALGAVNAIVTENTIPLMQGPSFIVEEVAGVTLAKGMRVEILSRTSFTDRLAAIPDDYWYYIQVIYHGTARTGYVHGSALKINPGITIPVIDPPGYQPAQPVSSPERYTVVASIDRNCAKTVGTLTVPPKKAATYFTIARFDSSYTACPDWPFGSIIGFSIVSADNPGNEFFSYEEHIADDPEKIQLTKDGFYYFDLESGTYSVIVRGGPDTVLELTYELVTW